jgi:hypothetical protein
MHDVSNSVNERFRGGSEHARHDRLLVSRFGAGDAYPSEEAEARELVGRCAECARLAADMQVLRSSLAALPAPRRDRDFRLTAEQADRLRGSALQRWLRTLAGPGLAPVRPLAGVALSVGLVLVMVGVALPSPAGEIMALDQANDRVGSAPMYAESTPPAEAAPPVGGQPGAEATAVPDVAEEPGAADDLGLDGELAQAEFTRSLLIVSGLLIGSLSLAVLLVVILARRRTADRLLR